MKVIPLKKIDIFTPSVNGDAVRNDDFHIDNYLHYNLIVNDDGTLWKHGNLYLLSKLKSYSEPNHLSIKSYARELKNFKEWCDNENIDYINVTRKILRPTYKYRAYLQDKLSKGVLSPSTVKKKISVVIGFYKYLIEIEGIKFKFPLWEDGMTSISYQDSYGFSQMKQVNTTDVGRVISAPNPYLYEDAIVDGGKLYPLDKEQQIALINVLKKIGDTEILYAFLIALTTGARMQTVFTLRLKHFDRTPSDNEEEVKIKIGLGTNCDTKYDKQHILFMPKWLYEKIRIYINSPRAKKRRDKAKHIFDTQEAQYLFLTSRGSPFYAGKDDPYRNLSASPISGGSVRQFIFKYLNPTLQDMGFSFHFSFHDLRATYGMNLLDKSKPYIKSGDTDIFRVLHYIKERMGHSSLTTTEKYLNFRDKHKIKEKVQNDYEDYIYEMLNVAS